MDKASEQEQKLLEYGDLELFDTRRNVWGRKEERYIASAGIWLSDFNFIDSLESKMMKEAGITSYTANKNDGNWHKNYYLVNGLHQVSGSGKDILTATLNAIRSYIENKEKYYEHN